MIYTTSYWVATAISVFIGVFGALALFEILFN